MCESRAYLLRDGAEELLLDDVEFISFDGEKVLVRNILGEEKIVEAHVKEIDFVDHKATLEKFEG